MDKVGQEYERLQGLFENADQNKLKALDGLIMECARTKIDLDRLNEIAKNTGLVKVHPDHPELQKALPVANEITKVRASYTNIIDKLCRHLATNLDEDDEGLDDYE